VLRKWAPLRVFKKVCEGTVEPILLYATDICYPSQIGLQQSLERTHRYAARLASNDFKSEYPVILEKLGWKSLQQKATERGLTLLWSYVHGKRDMCDNVFELVRQTDRRVSSRTGHAKQLVLPTTTKAHVHGLPLNILKRQWNALRKDEVEAPSKPLFKSALHNNQAYPLLIQKKLVHDIGTSAALRGSN